MRSDWTSTDVGAICSKVTSGGTPKTSVKEYYENGSIPWLNTKEVRFNTIWETEKKITEEALNNSAAKMIPANCVIVAMYGATAGKVAVNKVPLSTNQACCNLIINEELADYRFIYYNLSGRTKYLLDLANGAAQQNLNSIIIKGVPLNLPPLPEQKAIAHILGTLDDKIELNRKMNETLEQMAQALFKSWFVDFDPVIDKALAAGNEIPEPLQKRAKLRKELGDQRKPLPAHIAEQFPDSFTFTEELGWIPEGWEAKKIGELVTIKRGGSPRPIKDFIVKDGFPWVKISDATSEKSPFIFSTKEFIKEEGLRKTVYLKKGSLILSNSATPGLPKFLNIDACIHDGWLYFPEKEGISDAYLYFLFLKIRRDLVQLGNGSVFTNLKTDIVKSFDLVIAGEGIMDFFQTNCTSILNRLHSSRLETANLESIRDTLLPKLISGELRVPEADQLIAEHV